MLYNDTPEFPGKKSRDHDSIDELPESLKVDTNKKSYEENKES